MWLMMNKVILCWYLLAFAVQTLADSGAEFYQTCAACHGKDGAGNSAIGAPTLAGQQPSYIERQLRAFKQGWRGTNPQDSSGKMMRVAVAALASDKAIRSVAQYSAALTGSAKPAGLRSAPELIQKNGKAMYLGVCAACHGVNGEGLEILAAPRLNNLTTTYVIKQLQAYKNGSRGSHAQDSYGKQMQQMGALLADEQQISEVAEYITSTQY